MALYTVPVKSSAITAGRRMFDLKYHEQTVHSVSLQGSVPLQSHRRRSALTRTRHTAVHDTLPVAAVLPAAPPHLPPPSPPLCGGHPLSNQRSLSPSVWP